MDIRNRILLMKDSEFSTISLEVYQNQVRNNPTFFRWHELTKQLPNTAGFRFLPIRQFKKEIVKTGDWEIERVFESSSTTNTGISRHAIESLSFYEEISQRAFELQYGSLDKYHILALLPGYIERGNSSLVHMIKSFMDQSKGGDFYIHNFDQLNKQLNSLNKAGESIILFGVSHALIDFSMQYPQAMASKSIIVETGGMKGKRKEIQKSELHQILKTQFNVANIHGEYGMTELQSQAYSRANGLYHCPPWMKVVISDINDPTKLLDANKRGRINIIDLANVSTCSFIATDDLGIVRSDGSFEIIGRIQYSDIRGCNQMYQ